MEKATANVNTNAKVAIAVLGSVGCQSLVKPRPRSWHFAAILVFSSLMVAPMGGSPAMAQTATPADFILRTHLFAQQPIIAEGTESDNWIRGVVINDGNAPASVRILVTADGQILHNATHLILPGDANREEITLGWGGPSLASGRKQSEINLAAAVQTEEGVEDVYRVTNTLIRKVQRNELRLEADPNFAALQNVEPDQTAVVARFLVKNLGNAPDTGRLSFSNATWDFQVSPTTVELQPNETAPVYVTAKSPADAAAGSQGTATIELSTSEPRVANSLRDQLDLSTPSVQVGDHLRVTANPVILHAVPGAAIDYGIQVFNPTAEAATVRIALEETGSLRDVALSGMPSESYALAPGNDLEFALTGVVLGRSPGNPSQALAGARKWNVSVLDDATGELLGRGSLLLEVDHVRSVELLVPQSTIPAEAVPGTTFRIPLRVANNGNAPDVVCIRAELPDGWAQDDQCVLLAPWQGTQSWQDLSWRAELAPNASSGSQRLVLRAGSQTAPAVKGPPQTITISVLARTHPTIIPLAGPIRPVASEAQSPAGIPFVGRALPCDFPADPGETIRIPLQVKNDGNKNGTFRLSTPGLQLVPSSGWLLEVPREPIPLPIGSNASVTLVVTAPSPVEALDRATFDLRIEDVDDQGLAQTVPCRVEAAFPDIVPAMGWPATAPADFYAGHAAELAIFVANAGWNATATASTVESLVKGPDGFFLRQDHRVDPLESQRAGGTWSQRLAVNFTPTKPGMYTYTIHVDPSGLIDQMGPPSNNKLSGQVMVHDFGIRVIAPIGRVVIPEQRIAFEGPTAFKVRNEGTRPHVLDLLVKLEPEWKAAERQTISLGPGQERRVEVNFTVPRLPFAPGAVLTVRAANATLPALAVEGEARIRVDDNEAPEISNLKSTSPHLLVGETVRFTASMADAAGIAEARLFVVGEGGEVANYAMKGHGPVGDFEASVRFASVGEHFVHAWARDASVSNNTATTQSHPLRIEVLSSDRPHIRLVTPANQSAVRPGTPLVFSIVSSRPVTHLEYGNETGAPTPLPIRNPVQIPTAGWADGPISLRLRAHDNLGIEDIGVFSFIIDGAAPQVTGILLNPPGAAPGERVRVTASVSDASPLQSVVARLDSGAGAALEIRLARDATGTWTADLVLPERLGTVTVLATDAAGNQGFGEILTPSEASSGSSRSNFLPATAAALGLVAVVAVTILYRWRQERP